MGASIAVLALLGEVSSVDLMRKHHHQKNQTKSIKNKHQNRQFSQINTDEANDENLVQKMDDFDYDDGDKFMEDSIKEAEAEEKAKKAKGGSSASMEM